MHGEILSAQAAQKIEEVQTIEGEIIDPPTVNILIQAVQWA